MKTKKHQEKGESRQVAPARERALISIPLSKLVERVMLLSEADFSTRGFRNQETHIYFSKSSTNTSLSPLFSRIASSPSSFQREIGNGEEEEEERSFFDPSF